MNKEIELKLTKLDFDLSVCNYDEAQLQAENERLREVVEWLALDHKIDITSYKRAEYWARQFKVATMKARAALQHNEVK